MKYNKTWDIYRVLHGSHAFGTNTEESDEDIKGVCIPPLLLKLDPFFEFEQYETTDPDVVIYNIDKYFKMALKGNPNILETLYAEDSEVLYIDDLGKMIRNNRDIFLSKKVADTFGSYGDNQLRRLKNHKKHIENLPNKPDRKKMGLPVDSKLIPNHELIKINKKCGFKPETKPNTNKFMIVCDKFNRDTAEKWQMEQEYSRLLKEFQNYEMWVNTRNPKRFKVEQKIGYDSVFGSHILRLLRVCKEILSTGKVNIKRPDAEELLWIKQGNLPYEDMMSEAEQLYEEIKILKETSNMIPEEPDYEKARELIKTIYKMRYNISVVRI